MSALPMLPMGSFAPPDGIAMRVDGRTVHIPLVDGRLPSVLRIIEEGPRGRAVFEFSIDAPK